MTQRLKMAIDIHYLAKQEAVFQNGVLDRPLPIDTDACLGGQAVVGVKADRSSLAKGVDNEGRFFLTLDQALFPVGGKLFCA